MLLLRRMAVLCIVLALAGCASMPAGPGQTPNAGGSDSESHSEPGPALELGPPTMPADQVQFFPASKPATGTALDISLPSIRNTRPCDADNRVSNAS